MSEEQSRHLKLNEGGSWGSVCAPCTVNLSWAWALPASSTLSEREGSRVPYDGHLRRGEHIHTRNWTVWTQLLFVQRQAYTQASDRPLDAVWTQFVVLNVFVGWAVWTQFVVCTKASIYTGKWSTSQAICCLVACICHLTRAHCDAVCHQNACQTQNRSTNFLNMCRNPWTIVTGTAAQNKRVHTCCK